jgi:hypothetical protein
MWPRAKPASTRPRRATRVVDPERRNLAFERVSVAIALPNAVRRRGQLADRAIEIHLSLAASASLSIAFRTTPLSPLGPTMTEPRSTRRPVRSYRAATLQPRKAAPGASTSESSNEWLVRGYRAVGIFAFGPIFVRHFSGGEGKVDRDAAFACFPEFRIFSVDGGQFVEFDREAGSWSPVSYDTIMSASPRAAGPVDAGDGSAAAEAEQGAPLKK